MDLKLGSWREGFFYAHELDLLLGLNCGKILNRIRDLKDAERYLRTLLSKISNAEIVNKLGKNPHQFNDKHTLVTHLKSKFSEEHQLPNDAYQWLEDNLKACAFCYQFLYLRSCRSDDKIIDDAGKALNPKYLRQPLIKTTTFPRLPSFLRNRDRIRIPLIRHRKLTPNTISELIDCIKTSFKESEIDIAGQEYILALVADAWKEASTKNECSSFSKWFNIDIPEQTSWFKEYYAKKYPNIQLSWNSVNEQDYFYILYAEFCYLCLIDLTFAKLLLKEARNSWNQRNFQSKNKGTRSRSISMSERTNKRLDWLVNNKDKKINAFIKELIDLEFEHLGGPSKL
ncbi:hypothetical protein [Vibrio sp. 779(2023)]|uniref:hypothetical protein n=1 Tax=Vibrio sp. 779(2023) TaxID=3074712 RepID=UPI002966E690|nr:hypothetical protein [Vibrio sp. 779(2023)]MDW3152619.1 hypothetical protein [Vibrio sp. 779(2023)]